MTNKFYLLPVRVSCLPIRPEHPSTLLGATFPACGSYLHVGLKFTPYLGEEKCTFVWLYPQ
jgi:hypothetical protein